MFVRRTFITLMRKTWLQKLTIAKLQRLAGESMQACWRRPFNCSVRLIYMFVIPPTKIPASDSLKRGKHIPQSISVWLWSRDRSRGGWYYDQTDLEVNITVKYQPAGCVTSAFSVHYLCLHVASRVTFSRRFQCAVLLALHGAGGRWVVSTFHVDINMRY